MLRNGPIFAAKLLARRVTPIEPHFERASPGGSLGRVAAGILAEADPFRDRNAFAEGHLRAGARLTLRHACCHFLCDHLRNTCPITAIETKLSSAEGHT